MPRVLILPCSKRKKNTPVKLPAIERYDGPFYKILRKYLKTNAEHDLTTYILSSKYGLILAQVPILNYNQKMDASKALLFQPFVSNELNKIAASQQNLKILVCTSGVYLEALGGLEYLKQIFNSHELTVARGSIGKQGSILHRWLYDQSVDLAPTNKQFKKIFFKGKSITVNYPQIVKLVEQAIVSDFRGSQRFASWYVQVNGFKVAPKWVTSLITGCPVSRFRTADAIQFLNKLGFTIYRV